MSPFEFYELTPVEFANANQDFEDREYEKIKVTIESNNKSIWTAIRWQTMYIYNANAKRGKGVRRPEQLGKFEWEKGDSVQTVEGAKALLYSLAGKPIKQ